MSRFTVTILLVVDAKDEDAAEEAGEFFATVGLTALHPDCHAVHFVDDVVKQPEDEE